VHEGPTLDPKLAHIMPQVASMGAAVAVADFDRDGWQDFYVTNSGEGSLNHLYRNQRDGTFKDVAGDMGVADVNRTGTGVSMAANKIAGVRAALCIEVVIGLPPRGVVRDRMPYLQTNHGNSSPPRAPTGSGSRRLPAY
jgi:hypothetical protein